MHKQISIARTFAVVALMAMGPMGCTDDGGDPDMGTDSAPLTGAWAGGFTTDNQTVSMGTFSFDLTENASRAITGPFTGTAAGQNLAGTLTGTRTADRLSGSVAVTAPIALTLSFPDAAINDDTITGSFTIAAPFAAKGMFTVTRK